MIKIINNKYKVIKKIGSGSSGIVYLVTDDNNDEIALKILSKKIKKDRIRRLKKEFNIMKSSKIFKKILITNTLCKVFLL